MSRKRIWGDTRRVEVGERHRAVDPEDNIPTGEYEEDQDITKPHHMLERAPDAVVTVADAMLMWERIDRVKSDAKRAKAESPATRIESVEVKMRIVWGLLVAALTLAGASSWTAVRYLYKAAGDERERELITKRLLESEAELARRLRNVEDIQTRSVQRLDDIFQNKGVK